MDLGVAGLVGHSAAQHALGSRQGHESVKDHFPIMVAWNVLGTQPKSPHAIIYVQVGNCLAAAVNEINFCLYIYKKFKFKAIYKPSTF